MAAAQEKVVDEWAGKDSWGQIMKASNATLRNLALPSGNRDQRRYRSEGVSALSISAGKGTGRCSVETCCLICVFLLSSRGLG